MHPYNILFSPVTQALGYTLLYSFGQAFIIFICLRILLKLIQNVSAHVKYCLSFFSYLGIAIWFVITFVQQFSITKNQEVFEKITGNGFSLQSTFNQNNAAPSSIFSLSFLNEYLPWIVGLYLLGLFWYSLRLSLYFFQSNRLKKKGLCELDTDWQEHIINLCERMNIKRPLNTFFSRCVNTPMMIGFLKPVILLPLATMNHLTPQQFEAILLHELAHIRRNDYLLNIFQSIIDAFLFFNPFSCWISKYIREERENCCDEMVLQLSDPYHYAHALIALEEPLRNQPLIMTAIGKRSHLFNRIKNIMEMKNNPLNLRQKFITLFIIIAAMVSVAWLSPNQKIVSHTEKGSVATTNSPGVYLPPVLAFLSFNNITDSVPQKIAPLSPIPPVAMSHNSNGPLPPTAPLPPLPPNPGLMPVPPIAPLPPLPPVPPLPPSNISDSFPTSEDFFKSKEWKQQQEAIKKSTDEMRKFFQSEAWKKQQDLIQQNATAMKKYFNSPEWKHQQQMIKQSAEAMRKYFQSDAWKKQQELMKQNGEIMKKYFNSPEWKEQQKLMKQNGEKIEKYFNSPEWKKQQELIQKNAEKVQQYFNSPEWKKQQEEIRHISDSLTAYFKSDTWQKQQDNIQKAIAQTQKYFQSDDWQKQLENLKNATKDSQEKEIKDRVKK